MEVKMEDTQEDLRGYRDNILEPVTQLYRLLEEKMDWGLEPVKEVEDLMDEIFKVVTRSLGIKE